MARPRETFAVWLLNGLLDRSAIRHSVKSCGAGGHWRRPPWCWRWASPRTRSSSASSRRRCCVRCPDDAPDALVLINEQSPVSEREAGRLRRLS